MDNTDKKRKYSSLNGRTEIKDGKLDCVGDKEHKRLGKGSYGEVFAYGKIMALKKVYLRNSDGDVDPVIIESFAKECAVALKMMGLQIPGVVTTPRKPKIVLDEDGAPLYGHLFMTKEEHDANKELFDYGEIFSIFRQILNALSLLSERGIGHLDIKPRNILVSGRGEKIKAYLCDFGLCCLPGPGTNMYNPWHYVVTRWYRAPEAFKIGHAFDYHKVDIYSLGVSILELACGCPLSETIFELFGYVLRTKRFRESEDKYYEDILLTKSNLERIIEEMMRKCVFRSPDECEKKHIEMLFELLEKMMSFDPNDRPTAKEALMHHIFTVNDSPKGVDEL